MSRTPTVRLAAALVVALVLPPHTSAQDTSPSNAQVIAQGVVPFTGEALDWRVYDLEADLDAPREAFGAATGFTLAADGDFLVTDGSTGRRTLLSPGEAALSADGDVIRIDAAGDEPSAYTRIALLPDDFTDDGGTEPAYVSDDFDSPTGDHDVSLVRGLLGPGEEASLPSSDLPILLLVTDGEAAVTYGESDGATPVSAGEALGVDGPVFVANEGDEPAVFVAAVIGERVAGEDALGPSTDVGDDATPAASPEPDVGDTGSTDGTGTLSFAVEVCPLGGVAEGCETRSDVALIEVAGPGLIDEPILSYDAAVADDGSVAFADLPYGAYEFQIVEQTIAGELILSGDIVADPARPGVYTLDIDADTPAPVVTVSILPATGEGSIAVAFYRCPASLPVEQAAVWYCGADPTGWDLSLSGTTIGGDILLADAPGTGDGTLFPGLPLGGVYTLELTSAPEDVATIGVRPGLIAEGPVRVDLDETAPAQTVTYLGIVDGEILTPSADTDADGLADNYETDVYGTDPGLPDTDGDESPDATEVANGTNPLDAESYANG